jgi:KDO2-lipid IV(A) lauroyltransferase
MSTTTIETPGERKKSRRTRHPSRFLQRLKWSAGALALAAIWQVAALMSPDRASSLARGIVKGMAPRLKRTGHITRNLRTAFPEKTGRQIQELAREVWGSAGQLLVEYAHLKTLCITNPEDHLEVVRNWDAQAYRRGDKPAVFVTAHMANWELAAAMAAAVGVPLTVVYTPLKNPYIDRMLQRRRRAVGCAFVTKKAASRQILRELQKGRGVGLLVDQRVNDGELVPFFGEEALTSISPARLALKFGCDLVPVQVERLGGSRFRVTFHPPVQADDDAADNHEKALRMTRKVNEHFEAWIREQPEQWICWKRRWPKPG